MHFLLQCPFFAYIARVKSFFRLDGCLWLFINLISLKHSFASNDCYSDLKAVWIRGKTLLLLGLKVATNAKLLLSDLAFEALIFSMGILVTFQIASWFKFRGYSCEYITFRGLSKRFYLTSLFSTLVQILLASVKGIFFLHYWGWQELNETHLRVSVF